MVHQIQYRYGITVIKKLVKTSTKIGAIDVAAVGDSEKVPKPKSLSSIVYSLQ